MGLSWIASFGCTLIPFMIWAPVTASLRAMARSPVCACWPQRRLDRALIISSQTPFCSSKLRSIWDSPCLRDLPHFWAEVTINKAMLAPQTLAVASSSHRAPLVEVWSESPADLWYLLLCENLWKTSSEQMLMEISISSENQYSSARRCQFPDCGFLYDFSNFTVVSGMPPFAVHLDPALPESNSHLRHHWPVWCVAPRI